MSRDAGNFLEVLQVEATWELRCKRLGLQWPGSRGPLRSPERHSADRGLAHHGLLVASSESRAGFTCLRLLVTFARSCVDGLAIFEAIQHF